MFLVEGFYTETKVLIWYFFRTQCVIKVESRLQFYSYWYTREAIQLQLAVVSDKLYKLDVLSVTAILHLETYNV